MIEITNAPQTIKAIDEILVSLKKGQKFLKTQRFSRIAMTEVKASVLRRISSRTKSQTGNLKRGWVWRKTGRWSWFLYNRNTKMNPEAKLWSLEIGAKPHPIVPVRKKTLRFIWEKAGGGVFFFKKVKHPGITGRHFIRDTERDVTRIIRRMWEKELKVIFKRLVN